MGVPNPEAPEFLRREQGVARRERPRTAGAQGMKQASAMKHGHHGFLHAPHGVANPRMLSLVPSGSRAARRIVSPWPSVPALWIAPGAAKGPGGLQRDARFPPGALRRRETARLQRGEWWRSRRASGEATSSPRLRVTRKSLPSRACAAVAPRHTIALGFTTAISESSHGRQAVISRKLGLAWILRFPRGSHLKCFTTLVT